MSLTTTAAQIQNGEASENHTHVLIINGKPATDNEYTRVMLATPKQHSEAEIQRALSQYAPRPFTIER